ncbi:MAG: hypothetical protein JNM67_12305 [Bacteroidetes bacterium]|nr:hypothetical protein [Bacteroidota bacterium]
MGLKFNSLIAFIALLYCGASLKSQNISGSFDAYEMGAWAMTQHNSICLKIYFAIKNDKSKVINIDRATALKYLGGTKHDTFYKKTEIIFETVYTSPNDRAYLFLGTKDNVVSFKIDKKVPEIKIEPTFIKNLNEEELAYLSVFDKGGKAYFDSIPMISQKLIFDLNLRLYKEASNPSSVSYINDSLTTLLTQEQKLTRGGFEVVVFISTDPNDPTIGLDSVYYIPYENQINDSSRYIGINYVMSFSNLSFSIAALSSTFESMRSIRSYNLFPYGYLKIDTIQTLSPSEMQFIFYLIRFSINDKLKTHKETLNEYLKTFGITPIYVKR